MKTLEYITKECTECERELTVNNFSYSSTSNDGLRPTCKACNRRYKLENIEYYRRHQRDNRGRYNASKTAYAMRQKGLAPDISYREKQAIIALYVRAQRLSEKTGILHHVDHIIPRSKGGLHVLSNLQILTAKENRSKYTKTNEEWLEKTYLDKSTTTKRTTK